MTSPNERWIKLAVGEVSLSTGEIVGTDPGDSKILSPKLRDLLTFLADHRGQLVTRDDLLTGVWGHLEAGSEESVNVAVSSLRKALGDHQRPFELIQTLPRRGYRYVGPEPELRPEPALAAPESEPLAGPIRGPVLRRYLPIVLVLIALIAVVFVKVWPLEGGQTPPQQATAVTETSIEPDVQESAKPTGVAVLPFLDLSESGDQTPFADGLVDSILHTLAQVPDLRVVARTSSFTFRNRQVAVPEIARELGVNAVLEGSVQRSSQRLRVIAQLIDASGDHLWSRTYDREVNDLFDIQDDIAVQVSSALQRTLDLKPKGSQQLAVFEQMALGKSELAKDTVAGAKTAIGHYQKALELAPDSVPAMVGLADSMRQQGRLEGRSLDHPGLKDLKALVLRAHEAAPGDARTVKARSAIEFLTGSRVQAEALLKQVTELAPNDAEAFMLYGRVLWRRGAFDQALDQLRIAKSLDPLSDTVTALLADAYWAVGRAEQAMAGLRQGLRRNPNFPRFYDRLATYLNQMGQTGEAMRYIQAQRQLDPESALRWFRVCEFYNQLADPDASERCTDELERSHDVPDRVMYLRQQIAGFRRDGEQTRRLQRELHEAYPEMELIPTLLAMSHAAVDCPVVLSVFENAHPSVFDNPPILGPFLVTGAQMSVHCLREMNRGDEAEALLEAIDAIIEKTRLNRAPQYNSGFEGVVQLGLMGLPEAALQELSRLVNGNWRYYWWSIDDPQYYPMLADMRDLPGFQEIHQKLLDGVEEQRRYYQAHKGDPLN